MKNYTKSLFLLSLLSIFSFSGYSQIVRMETVLGTIEIEMHPDAAPNTVANFMNYMNDGDYNNSIIHRSIPGFVIQGGGYIINNGALESIVTDPAIENEFNLSNIRGTIAMAKGSDPDSATSQWFFNIADNSASLDNVSNSGGFTVFGTVVSGMEVVDAISLLQVWDNFAGILGAAFSDLPLVNYSGSGVIDDELVYITNVYDATFHINPGLNGAWYYPDTSGSGILLEIFPESDTVFMAWFTYDLAEPAEGTVADIGDAGHRWFTGLGTIDYDTNSISVTLKSTSGGLFDSSQAVINSTVGTVTITFEDCSNATVDYTLTDQELSSSFPIQRLLSDNVALCERLSPEVVTE